jgi:hypothetical protein
MSKIRRIIFATAAVTAAFIQGCGCSDSKKSSSPPPAAPTFTVTGTAAKGILRNFQVAAHRFNDGILDPTPIINTNTSNLGAYTLNIPQTYINQPLLFRVTPNPTGSIMTCDLSAGCGTNVDFGDDLPITDTEFQLDTVVSTTTDNSVANITLLTNLAAQLAQEALGNGATVAEIQSAIAESNSRVANRFGLAGNLTTMQVIDLTNTAAVNAALNAGNSSAVQYASFNAAIAQAASADNSALDFVAALNTFISYFVEEGLAGNTRDAMETSFADILEQARAILLQVQSDDPEAPQSLVALLQNLLTEQQLAESEEPDSYDQGTPSTGAGDSDLQKAKNMVADLRDFASSVGETSLEGGMDIATVSEEFAMQLEAAEMTTSGQAGYLLDAMAKASAAIDDANRAYMDNETLESFTSEGIDVSISVTDEKPVFTVDEEIQVETDTGFTSVTVELVAHNGLTIGDTSGETSSTVAANGDYRVQGSATSALLTLTVKEGSHVQVTELAETESDGNSTQSLDEFDFHLAVTLAQPTGEETDPLSLDGSLTVSLADAMVENTESPNGESTDFTLGTVSLAFSGKVSNTTGESFNFSLSVSGDATGVSFIDGLGDGGETAEDYVAASASLAFTAQLTGIPSVVSVAYNVERTGLESAQNSLVVKYPGKLFRFNLAVEDGEPVNPLTVTNQDGAVLTLNENTVDGESYIDGNIKVNGTEHAAIEEVEVGTVIITYSDESVESL